MVERSSSSSSSSSSSGGGGGSSSGSSSGSSNSSSSSSSSSSSGSGSSRKIGKIRDLVRAEKDNKWIQPHPDRLSNLSSATGVLDRERDSSSSLSLFSLSLSPFPLSPRSRVNQTTLASFTDPRSPRFLVVHPRGRSTTTRARTPYLHCVSFALRFPAPDHSALSSLPPLSLSLLIPLLLLFFLSASPFLCLLSLLVL